MNDVIDLDERARSLKVVGHISYLLHTIVAVGAVLPGVQASVALLIVAFVIDLVKKTTHKVLGRSRTFAGASAPCCGPGGSIY